MSSQQQLGLSTPLGEIDHVKALSENFASLLISENYSDIILLIENQRIPAHKVILASRSEYFRALLFGGLSESQQFEVELKGISAPAFHLLLKYIYTGCLSLFNLKEELIRDLLGLAHQYAFPELEQSISDYFKSILNLNNVCLVYDVANLYQLRSLMEACHQYVDRYASDILQSEAFLHLSPGTLCDLLHRDSFCVPEVEIFRAVQRWWQNNVSAEGTLTARDSCNLQAVIGAIRLPLITLSELLHEVRPSNLVTADDILDALQKRTESRDSDLPHRGHLMIDVNVANARMGAQVLQGEMRTALLDGDTTNYDMERGFTRHPIEEGNAGIVVRLGKPYIINHIKMLLWDRDMRSYSYYIEVSMDQRDWVRVVDHSNYHCRSWQRLYFAQRVVRFIRVVGTHNTVNKVFHCVSLEAYYSPTIVRLEKELIVPKHNVSTIQLSACVLEGVSRSRNALLNGDTKNYDWDSGYTCHQLGSGAIVVQLAQPYYVSSMRLLLWDCDDRRYSFYVEVSTNSRDWITVCDRSRQPCQSWQTINFNPLPVVYVKIVGTHNTANDVFHCVHFECPAQEEGIVEESCGSRTHLSIDSSAPTPPPLPDFVNRRLDYGGTNDMGASAIDDIGDGLVDEAQGTLNQASRFSPNPDGRENHFLPRRNILRHLSPPSSHLH